jgi:hypothetical protein
MAVPSSVSISSTQTFSSTTPAPIVGLAFGLLAGLVYRFDFWVTMSSESNTNGPGLGIEAPAATVSGVHLELPQGTISNVVATNGITSATVVGNTALVSTGVTTGTDRHMGRLQGIIIPSAPGSLQVTCRREAASGTITVHPGSGGLLYQL